MELDLSTIIWSIVNFVALLILLRIFLFKPVMAMLDKRSKEVEESLTKAESARKELDQLKIEQAKELEAVRAEAQSARAAIAKQAEEDRAKTLAEAHTEAEKILARAHAQIDDDKERAIAAIKSEMASIAIAAASKVIERNLTGEDQEKLVSDLLEEVAN